MTVASLRRQAWEKRRRADNLWKDVNKITFEVHKKPFIDKIKGLYAAADKLDKQAAKLARKS